LYGKKLGENMRSFIYWEQVRVWKNILRKFDRLSDECEKKNNALHLYEGRG